MHNPKQWYAHFGKQFMMHRTISNFVAWCMEEQVNYFDDAYHNT